MTNGLDTSAGAGGQRREDTDERTYLEYINYVWEKDLEYSFEADEINLIFRLLKRANQLKKARFNLAVDKLMSELGIKTKRPFDTARKGLKEAGLLDFRNGNGRGCTTEYHLIGLNFYLERGMKNNPLSATLSAQFPRGFRNENALLHKSKSRSKNKEANASSIEQKVSASNPESNPTSQPSPEVEPWAAWLAEHAPDVQRMNEPITAGQWARLVDSFGEPTVQDVMQAMHNTNGLEKKYKSASLTARAWCKRRYPAGKPPPDPIKSSSPADTAPPLNHEFTAQLDARQQAEDEARRQQFRATKAPPTSA